jgi:hypothetical protein
VIHETRVAPPNSLILVMDREIGVVPDTMNKALVASTDSCVAIGTRAAPDGETVISLSYDSPPQLPNLTLAYDGLLSTPNKYLSVCSVYLESLLELNVLGLQTRVRVWVNHLLEPDIIWISAGKG